MKRLGIIGLAATMLLLGQLSTQSADAKSLRQMLDSAANSLNGRNAYWDNLRYNNPYYGYNTGGYPYGYNQYLNTNPYYGSYRPYGWY